MNTFESRKEDVTPNDNVSVMLVRALGVLILLGGLYSAFQVVNKAWSLLENPGSIVPFAEQIEKHAHLNSLANQLGIVSDLANKARTALASAQAGGNPLGSTTAPSPEPPPLPPANLAYLAAWPLCLVLLALVARISLWTVSEGAKLVIYSTDSERQLKLILRQLLQEVRTSK